MPIKQHRISDVNTVAELQSISYEPQDYFKFYVEENNKIYDYEPTSTEPENWDLVLELDNFPWRFIAVNAKDTVATWDKKGSTSFWIASHFTPINSSLDIFHIKLPYKIDTDSKMYHIKARWYAYSWWVWWKTIDVTWVWYCYKPSLNIVRTETSVNNSSTIQAGQYAWSDNHVYLWFKTPNTYFNTFTIDSIYVWNWKVLEKWDIEIIQDPAINL